MVDQGERMPVRLVQENGETIPLDATSIDIVVERIQSNFGIPLFDAKRMGIDLNQATVMVEIQGVLTDDTGQTASSKAVATLDFFQPQQIVSWGQPINSGGGNNSGPVASMFNQMGPAGNTSTNATTGIGGTAVNTGGFSGGIGGSFGGEPMSPADLGNRILQYWSKKYIDLPIAYWTDAGQSLDNPVKTGLQLWLKADSITDKSTNETVDTWVDSSGNGRNATSAGTKRPTFTNSGVGPAGLNFDGVDDEMEVGNDVFLNTEEFTIFTVARSTATSGDNPILSCKQGSTGGGDARGYALLKDLTNKDASALWREGGSADSITSPANTVINTGAQILTYTMDDTNADSQSDTATLFVNGKQEAQQTSGVDYVPNTSVNLKIGSLSTDFFQGEICEVLIYNSVLSDKNREQVEGYLSLKYGISLDYKHEYAGVGRYAHSVEHVRVVFDDSMVASKKEPYGFLNQLRETGMTVTNVVSGTTLTVTGGAPHEWFEPTESKRSTRVVFKRGSRYVGNSNETDLLFATVLTVNASQMTIRLDTPGTILDNDTVHIVPVDYGNGNLLGRTGSPVIVIPIQNADTFDEFANPEAAVGPTFPTYEDTYPRDTGGGLTRTDEYLTYLMSKAITASYMDVGREVDAFGNKTMDKVFSVDIEESYDGHNCRLVITQQYATSLGQLTGVINTTLGVGQMPVTQGFSGGKSGTAGSKSGRPIKSGGDKAQDLLGILANSNNYASNPDLNFVTTAFKIGTGFIKNQVNPPDASGDYIRGIQIPYLSHVTKGKNALDTHVAQRNFFVTTEGTTAQKLSSINTEHASRLFSHGYEGHLKNGISGLVQDIAIHRDAEMKAYEFSLRFFAADIII